MKTSITGILVFLSAIRAHLKPSHRRIRTVVGDILDDRESRTTISTVDKGVTKAPIIRVKHFRLALFTNRNIRRNRYEIGLLILAGDDSKVGVGFCFNFLRLDRVNLCQGRGMAGNFCNKTFYVLRIAYHLNIDTAGRVANPTEQAVFQCQVENKRAESYTLDDAGDMDVIADLGHKSLFLRNFHPEP